MWSICNQAIEEIHAIEWTEKNWEQFAELTGYDTYGQFWVEMGDLAEEESPHNITTRLLAMLSSYEIRTGQDVRTTFDLLAVVPYYVEADPALAQSPSQPTGAMDSCQPVTVEPFTPEAPVTILPEGPVAIPITGLDEMEGNRCRSRLTDLYNFTQSSEERAQWVFNFPQKVVDSVLEAAGIDLTFRGGLTGIAGAGPAVRGSLTIAVDTDGNIAVLYGGGGGGATPGANGGLFIGVTNAPIEALDGTSVQLGGEIGALLGIAAELEAIPGEEEGEEFFALDLSGVLDEPALPFMIYGTAEHNRFFIEPFHPEEVELSIFDFWLNFYCGGE